MLGRGIRLRGEGWPRPLDEQQLNRRAGTRYVANFSKSFLRRDPRREA
jgi:hypothetical protein